jgi:hypothetical protein
MKDELCQSVDSDVAGNSREPASSKDALYNVPYRHGRISITGNIRVASS